VWTVGVNERIVVAVAACSVVLVGLGEVEVECRTDDGINVGLTNDSRLDGSIV
jgi:hypothetical protein